MAEQNKIFIQWLSLRENIIEILNPTYKMFDRRFVFRAKKVAEIMLVFYLALKFGPKILSDAFVKHV